MALAALAAPFIAGPGGEWLRPLGLPVRLHRSLLAAALALVGSLFALVW